MIALSWVYEKSVEGHGERILVDRLWPRGIKKEEIKISLWMKEIAPSTDLRKWFSHEQSKWQEFKRRYFSELNENPLSASLISICNEKDVVFVYSAKDKQYNNAVALKEYIETHRNKDIH